MELNRRKQQVRLLGNPDVSIAFRLPASFDLFHKQVPKAARSFFGDFYKLAWVL